MERLRCVLCGEVIGVYEPVHVILRDGSDLKGSQLTLGPELERPGSAALHDQCYRSGAESPGGQHGCPAWWTGEAT
jgi:hypothetical protein